MSKPTGKLAMAYSTIATMEARIKELECQQAAGVAVPAFASKIIKKLERVHACFTDGQDADIGKDWFDILTKLGLLDRVQRSPALWQISDAGDALLDSLAAAPHPVSGEQKAQDVAGLVRAAEFARANICSWIDKYPAASHFNANRAINYLDQALAAHRAQQGEQPS